MSANTQIDKLLTIDEIAEACDVSTQTVSRWMKQNAIVQPIRIGRRLIRWRADDFQSWLNSKTEEAKNDA